MALKRGALALNRGARVFVVGHGTAHHFVVRPWALLIAPPLQIPMEAPEAREQGHHQKLEQEKKTLGPF